MITSTCLPSLEGEVLGGGQREARREQPLRRRIAREVEEQHRARERAGCSAAAAEGFAPSCRARRCRRTRSRSRRRCRSRSRAFWAISTAMRSCGRPPPEKSGSFWPRTRLFIRSIAVTPVSMNSCGNGARRPGSCGTPVDAQPRLAAIGGPPSIGLPTPLNTRPSRPGPTDRWIGSPRKPDHRSLQAEARRSTRAPRRHHAVVVDRGDAAEARVRRRVDWTSTASFRPTSTLRRRNSSGPSMPRRGAVDGEFRLHVMTVGPQCRRRA